MFAFICRLPFILPFLENLLAVDPLPCGDEVAELVRFFRVDGRFRSAVSCFISGDSAVSRDLEKWDFDSLFLKSFRAVLGCCALYVVLTC